MASPSQITHALLKEQGQKIVQLSADLSVMSNEISDIKKHLYTDEKTNGKGWIERAHNTESRVYRLEQREKIYLAKGGVIFTIAIGVGSIIIWVINQFIGRH